MRTYLITGSSRGIGRATALALAAQQDVQVLAISRATEGPSAASLHYLSFDLTASDHSPVVNWVKQFGPLDGILNNAGLLIAKPFEELSDTDWLEQFAINVFAPARLLRNLASSLKPGAHILNIGSMAGFQGSGKFPGLTAYSASKAAITSMTECLSEEWKERKVSVNCLALGAVQTEMLATAFPGYEAPLDSNEMAEYICWMLQKGGQFFNGKVIPVALNNP